MAHHWRSNALHGLLLVVLFVCYVDIVRGGDEQKRSDSGALDRWVADGVSSGRVVELSSDELTRLSDRANSTAFVMFYAPWCGACSSFQPVYEKFAAAVAAESIFVSRLNAVENSAEAAVFRLSGYPTIFHVHGQAIRTYTGTRNVDDLKDFALDKWFVLVFTALS